MQPRFQRWGVQFLGVRYYCPSAEKKLEMYTQFSAVCYPHQTPNKKLRKKLGEFVQIWWGGGPNPHPTPASGCAHAYGWNLHRLQHSRNKITHYYCTHAELDCPDICRRLRTVAHCRDDDSSISANNNNYVRGTAVQPV